MSLIKTLRCRYFDGRGRPLDPPCPRRNSCRFAHPDEREWDTAGPSKLPPKQGSRLLPDRDRDRDRRPPNRGSPVRTILTHREDSIMRDPRDDPRDDRDREADRRGALPPQSEAFGRLKVEEPDRVLLPPMPLDYGPPDEQPSPNRPGPNDRPRSPPPRGRSPPPRYATPLRAPRDHDAPNSHSRYASDNRREPPRDVPPRPRSLSRRPDPRSRDPRARDDPPSSYPADRRDERYMRDTAPETPRLAPQTPDSLPAIVRRKPDAPAPPPSSAVRSPIETIIDLFRDLARTTNTFTASTASFAEASTKLGAYSEISSKLAKLPASQQLASAVEPALAALLSAKEVSERRLKEDEEKLSGLWGRVFEAFVKGVAEGVEERVEGVMKGVEQRVGEVERRMEGVGRGVRESEGRVEELRRRLARVEDEVRAERERAERERAERERREREERGVRRTGSLLDRVEYGDSDRGRTRPYPEPAPYSPDDRRSEKRRRMDSPPPPLRDPRDMNPRDMNPRDMSRSREGERERPADSADAKMERMVAELHAKLSAQTQQLERLAQENNQLKSQQLQATSSWKDPSGMDYEATPENTSSYAPRESTLGRRESRHESNGYPV